MEVAKPIIKIMPDTKDGLMNFKDSLDKSANSKETNLICNYPTVYIHNWKKNDKFEVYVGESNDFFKRTQQHFDDGNKKDKWQRNIKNNKASLYVIAHPEFNKSLTLDVENRLILYLSSSSSVAKTHNAKGNPQNEYYTCDDLDEIFSKIWRQLRACNKDLFLSESEIKDSAIYKASPLHKLNEQQLEAKKRIIDNISACLLKSDEHQLVFVEGDAGTGKTVLMSSIFYDLINKEQYNIENGSDVVNYKNVESAIIVNNKEQLTVYNEIVKKLDLNAKKEKMVFKPTEFINLFKAKKNSPIKRRKLYDVVFVDEAHLLLTQKNQAYIEDDNQLTEIMKYAKVVVAMFDRKQIMNAEQYLDEDSINNYIEIAKKNNSFIKLDIQMRMQANKEVTNWIKSIYTDCKLKEFPRNTGKYDIKVFDTPKQLEKAIRSKAENKETALSRIVAMYDWDYSGQSRPKNKEYWDVNIGNWSMPWNYQLSSKLNAKEKRMIKNLAWAEQPHTINEIGSIYTIHGFDLNYVGVIIGPSVKYCNGKIEFYPSESHNDKATHKRTLADGKCKSFGEEFLKNELGVLLTRGVNGLYIYACDPELRKQLKKIVK